MRYYIFEYYFNQFTGCFAVREVEPKKSFTSKGEAVLYMDQELSSTPHLLILSEKVKPYIEQKRFRPPAQRLIIAHDQTELDDYRFNS